MDEFTIKPLRDAHDTLCTALAIKPADDIVRDAVIQRFEYTFELAWKNLKRVLEEEYGRREITIRDMFREGAVIGLLTKPEDWLEFHRARNLTSHTYSRKTAKDVYKIAKRFAKQAAVLISKLSAFETHPTQPKARPTHRKTHKKRVSKR